MIKAAKIRAEGVTKRWPDSLLSETLNDGGDRGDVILIILLLAVTLAYGNNGLMAVSRQNEAGTVKKCLTAL